MSVWLVVFLHSTILTSEYAARREEFPIFYCALQVYYGTYSIKIVASIHWLSRRRPQGTTQKTVNGGEGLEYQHVQKQSWKESSDIAERYKMFKKGCVNFVLQRRAIYVDNVTRQAIFVVDRRVCWASTTHFGIFTLHFTYSLSKNINTDLFSVTSTS